MNSLPTPETDALIAEFTLTEDAMVSPNFARDLERRLTIARAALESITHDMGASQHIHLLCTETLKQTAPKQ